MAETTNKGVNITNLILIPSVITLAITILRLVGELQNWSPVFFSKKPGGGGAIVGIAWLAPIFGIYFALKLAGAGERPANPLKALLFAVLGVVIVVAGFVGSSLISKTPTPAVLVVVIVAFIIAGLVQQKPWPALFKTLLVYGLAARIPVAIVMLIAIHGNWGTHYDVPPDESFPAMTWFMKWLMIGAVPQFLIWIPFTILSGLLFGSIAAVLAGRKSASKTAAA